MIRTIGLGALAVAVGLVVGCSANTGASGDPTQGVGDPSVAPSESAPHVFMTRERATLAASESVTGVVDAPSNQGATKGQKPGGNGISYHGGPLMTGTPDVYYIWYGNWSGNTATSILTSFIQNLGGSSYEHINTTYYDGSGTHLSGQIAYKSAYSVGEYLGAALSDAQILQIVSDAIAGGHLPYDANGLYFVLTSSDVNETSGFCSQYCGWHNHGNISSGQKVRYSFVGNPDRCPSACEAQTTSPNGNAGADGMASIVAHESEEAFSDPDGNAWYDTRGYENADKCAWTFGTESTASNGSKYNVTLGGSQYLIQQNWVNASGGYCAMSY